MPGKQCESCGLKQAHFGLPSDRKRRWCSACSKAHTGAVDMKNKMCEGCHTKHAHYGMPVDKKRRWCGVCAKQQVGAVDMKNKMCEICGLKHAHFGLPEKGQKRRWCSSCAKTNVVQNLVAAEKAGREHSGVGGGIGDVGGGVGGGVRGVVGVVVGGGGGVVGHGGGGVGGGDVRASDMDFLAASAASETSAVQAGDGWNPKENPHWAANLLELLQAGGESGQNGGVGGSNDKPPAAAKRGMPGWRRVAAGQGGGAKVYVSPRATAKSVKTPRAAAKPAAKPAARPAGKRAARGGKSGKQPVKRRKTAAAAARRSDSRVSFDAPPHVSRCEHPKAVLSHRRPLPHAERRPIRASLL